MNSFSSIIFFVLVALHPSRSSYIWERSFEREPKDSLACYRTLTLDLFQNLKKIVPKRCVEDGEDEFKSKIKSRDQYYALIKKVASNKELFIKGKQQAEEIGSKAITKIHRCLSYDCNGETQDEVNKVIEIFTKRSNGCGDSEYLSDAITTLKRTCIEEQNEKISKDMTSLFAGNKNGIHEMRSFWI